MKKYFGKDVLVKFTDYIVSVLIFFAIIALLFFMGYQTLEIILNVFSLAFSHTIHDLAFLIVIVKIYKILIFYLKTHHLSISYILEVAIIAPLIEIVFLSKEIPLSILIVYTVISVSCLIIYFTFYEKIKEKNYEKI